MSIKGSYVLTLVNLETGLVDRTIEYTNLVPWDTYKLIFDGRQVFKDCFIGISTDNTDPIHTKSTVFGEVTLGKTDLTYFVSSDDPSTVGLVEAPYGGLTATIQPNPFKTRQINSVFLTNKEPFLLTGIDPDTAMSIPILTYSKLDEPLFQEFNQLLVVDYRVQYINTGSSSIVKLNKTFPDKFGRYLHGLSESSQTSGLFTVSSSFSHVVNKDYLNVLFSLLPQNLVSTKAADFYLRYFIELLGVSDDSDPTIGKILGTLGYGNEDYRGPLSNASKPFTYSPALPSNNPSFDHQGTFYHFPNDTRPFLEKPYNEQPVGIDIRDSYAGQVIFSGDWDYKHWPEFYRINFTQTGIIPNAAIESDTAAYTFSYRYHLGFNGNQYVSDLVVNPYLFRHAYKDIYLQNKIKYSDTQVLCWTDIGFSIIDLITGSHKDYSKYTSPIRIDFQKINQIAISSTGVVYVASKSGLYEIIVEDDVVNRLVSQECLAVAVGKDNVVYVIDLVGLRISYLNYEYYRVFTPGSSIDEETIYSTNIVYRICQRLLIRQNEIKFIKASPIENKIALIIKQPLRQYKIIWWDLDRDIRLPGPDIDFTQSNYLKEENRTDWVECSKPGSIGNYRYPSVWFFTDSSGTYNTEFGSVRKTLIAPKELSLCHVSLYDNEPFIFTSADLRGPTGFVLAEYNIGTKLGNIKDLLGTVTHIFRGICLISSLSNLDIPSYLSLLGTDNTPFGSETATDLFQSFAYCKLWNHYYWNNNSQEWYLNTTFQPAIPNIDDKLVHPTTEPLINGINVAFQLVYGFKPIEIVQLPNIPITAICFDELLIDDFIVANADTIRWNQTNGRPVTVLSENTTRPFIRRRTSLVTDDGTAVVLTATICNPSQCITIDIPIFLTPTSTHNGFTLQTIDDDRECKRVPCKIRAAQEVYVEPPINLFQHRCGSSTFPLTAIYWDLPTCELDYLESTIVQRNIEGTYVDQQTYLVDENRIFLAATPGWYRIKSRFNNFGIISEAFSCVFYILPTTFGNHKQSITDDAYDRGFTISTTDFVTKLTFDSELVIDNCNGFTIHGVDQAERFNLLGQRVEVIDSISNEIFGGITVYGLDTTVRLGLGGIIVG